MTTTIPPISVQLYSVREASTKDFDQVLDLIAKIGYHLVKMVSQQSIKVFLQVVKKMTTALHGLFRQIK